MGLDCILQNNPSLELRTWDKQGVDRLCAKWHRMRFKGDSMDCLLKLSIKSHSLSPPIPSPFTRYPLFQGYPQSKEILWNLSMKVWYSSAFNAQGSRVFILVVQVGAVKIYVAAVETLRKNERGDETQGKN
jgi:hypothetical protein